MSVNGALLLVDGELMCPLIAISVPLDYHSVPLIAISVPLDCHSVPLIAISLPR